MIPSYSKHRWQQIQTLLDVLLDLPEAEQLPRLQQLRQQSEDDPQLFSAVQSLLLAQRNAPDFLDQPAIELAEGFTTGHADENLSASNNADLLGQCIGPYRLCEVIGQGGMGVVFRAERCEGGFEQQVAIKLLSLNQMSEGGLERFQREQQLLATLIHPGIAQLYDGGTTAAGQAYIVME
jgi:hypothetical protein